jgi:hypothetical protein
MTEAPAVCTRETPSSCTLPCAGCDDAIAAKRHDTCGHDIEKSPSDGCWVVRIGFAEKLRSDNPCLACSYFRNKTDLLAG